MSIVSGKNIHYVGKQATKSFELYTCVADKETLYSQFRDGIKSHLQDLQTRIDKQRHVHSTTEFHRHRSYCGQIRELTNDCETLSKIREELQEAVDALAPVGEDNSLVAQSKASAPELLETMRKTDEVLAKVIEDITKKRELVEQLKERMHKLLTESTHLMNSFKQTIPQETGERVSELESPPPHKQETGSTRLVQRQATDRFAQAWTPTAATPKADTDDADWDFIPSAGSSSSSSSSSSASSSSSSSASGIKSRQFNNLSIIAVPPNASPSTLIRGMSGGSDTDSSDLDQVRLSDQPIDTLTGVFSSASSSSSSSSSQASHSEEAATNIGSNSSSNSPSSVTVPGDDASDEETSQILDNSSSSAASTSESSSVMSKPRRSSHLRSGGPTGTPQARPPLLSPITSSRSCDSFVGWLSCTSRNKEERRNSLPNSDRRKT